MLHCDISMLHCNDILPRGRLPHDFSDESIGFFDRARTNCASGVQHARDVCSPRVR
jgi:hypothetical protein